MAIHKTNQDPAQNKLKRALFGRRQIFTNAREITEANVAEVVNNALYTHWENREDIQYLHRYLRGDQPILYRVKAVHNEICNKIVLNRANQIVTFKTANFIGEPLQYISRGADEAVPPKIEMLNSFMMSENKASLDMDLAYWMFTCGVGYRLVLRDKAEAYLAGDLFDEAPFELYTLDPRNTFVIRLNDVTQRVVAAVTYVFRTETEVRYTVYTARETFYLRGTMLSAGVLEKRIVHQFGYVPIIEYPCNALRMGAFEPVLDLLDAINLTESNRLDGVEQFIQALLVFKNVDITREEMLELKDLGAIKLPSRDGLDTDVFYINEQLDQGQTQTLVDDMWRAVLEIVGMPSQGDANASDSSNNGAVYMKNGLYTADARMAETEAAWKNSETAFLKIILKICRDTNALDLRISQIDPKFGLRGYEDMLTKTQSFTTLMGAGCSPLQSATISNLVSDPESFAITYDRYNAQKQAEMEAALAAQTVHADAPDELTPEDESDV